MEFLEKMVTDETFRTKENEILLENFVKLRLNKINIGHGLFNFVVDQKDIPQGSLADLSCIVKVPNNVQTIVDGGKLVGTKSIDRKGNMYIDVYAAWPSLEHSDSIKQTFYRLTGKEIKDTDYIKLPNGSWELTGAFLEQVKRDYANTILAGLKRSLKYAVDGKTLPYILSCPKAFLDGVGPETKRAIYKTIIETLKERREELKNIPVFINNIDPILTALVPDDMQKLTDEEKDKIILQALKKKKVISEDTEVLTPEQQKKAIEEATQKDPKFNTEDILITALKEKKLTELKGLSIYHTEGIAEGYSEILKVCDGNMYIQGVGNAYTGVGNGVMTASVCSGEELMCNRQSKILIMGCAGNPKLLESYLMAPKVLEYIKEHPLSDKKSSTDEFDSSELTTPSSVEEKTSTEIFYDMVTQVEEKKKTIQVFFTDKDGNVITTNEGAKEFFKKHNEQLLQTLKTSEAVKVSGKADCKNLEAFCNMWDAEFNKLNLLNKLKKERTVTVSSEDCEILKSFCKPVCDAERKMLELDDTHSEELENAIKAIENSNKATIGKFKDEFSKTGGVVKGWEAKVTGLQMRNISQINQQYRTSSMVACRC